MGRAAAYGTYARHLLGCMADTHFCCWGKHPMTLACLQPFAFDIHIRSKAALAEDAVLWRWVVRLRTDVFAM